MFLLTSFFPVGVVLVEAPSVVALEAGIHVCLVVVADEDRLVTALDGTGQRLEADVEGAAVTGEAHDRDIVLALDLQGFRDAGGKGGQAHKDSLNGGNAPASLIAAACQNGRATRRCHRDSLRTQNLQCRTANEFHGTALAGSQAFTQQIQFSHCCAPHFLSNRSRWVHHR